MFSHTGPCLYTQSSRLLQCHASWCQRWCHLEAAVCSACCNHQITERAHHTNSTQHVPLVTMVTCTSEDHVNKKATMAFRCVRAECPQNFTDVGYTYQLRQLLNVPSSVLHSGRHGDPIVPSSVLHSGRHGDPIVPPTKSNDIWQS